MVFCGQCGLQLTPGATRCPRCGAAIEGDVTVEELHTDDPTVASFPYVPHTPPQPDPYNPTGAAPPNTLRRSVSGADKQLILDANAPTSKVDAPTYSPGSPRSPSSPNIGPSYVDTLSPYRAAQQAVPSQRAKGRLASLVIILFGLLLILGAMVIFALKQNGLIGGITGKPGGTVTTLAPEDQAKALIQQYYNDINQKDYQDAYNLWKDDPHKPNFATFSQGFAHTQHDDITVDNVTTLNNGNIRVSITLKATEDAASGTGTQNSVYKGYYMVGPQNGVLKILFGQLNKVA